MKGINDRLSILEAKAPKYVKFTDYDGKPRRIKLLDFIVNYNYYSASLILGNERDYIVPPGECARVADQLDALPNGYKGTLLLEIITWLRKRAENKT